MMAVMAAKPPGGAGATLWRAARAALVSPKLLRLLSANPYLSAIDNATALSSSGVTLLSWSSLAVT